MASGKDAAGSSSSDHSPFATHHSPGEAKHSQLATHHSLARIGERYHEHRRDLMLRLWLGFTDIYNLFHTPALELRLGALFKRRMARSEWRTVEKVPAEHLQTAGSLSLEEAIAGIERLRSLHVELDYTVLAAYGWGKANSDQRIANGEDASDSSSSPHSPFATHHSPEIVLGHDFHDVETLPENDRTRYTIPSAVRKELLTRLLKLNHQRAAEEAAKVPVKSTKTGKPQRAKKEDEML